MVSPLAIGAFPLDLWGFAAGLLFVFVALNPFAWLNGKRLIVGTTALAMMLGCVALNMFSNLILELVSLFEPNGFAMIPATSPAYFLGIIGSLLLMPVVMIFAGSFVIVILFGIVSAFFTFFIGVPVMLFNQILAFDNALHIYRYQARGLASYIVRFVFWLRNEIQAHVPDDTRGARFATVEEIARLHNPRGMGFGHVKGQLLQLHTEKHVLIMASTRSGKGVTLIIPHLLRYEGSAFVLDPKGENAKATGRHREALNRKVYYLDPFGISGKPQARFNPLSRFTPDNMEAESKALAAALFVLGEGEKRDHWFSAGQQLLAAIILFVYVLAANSQGKERPADGAAALARRAHADARNHAGNGRRRRAAARPGHFLPRHARKRTRLHRFSGAAPDRHSRQSGDDRLPLGLRQRAGSGFQRMAQRNHDGFPLPVRA